MNIPRLTQLGQVLCNPLPHDYQFNMNTFMRREGTYQDHWCGTECCLAGLAVLVFDSPRPKAHISTATHASQLLDLTSDQASALFFPYHFHERHWEDITPTRAAQAIQNLIAGSLRPWG